MKKISIVTISFNQGKYLEKCIQSVINQKYKNYEHIIVDNNSTDNTESIIKKYKHHFSKIIIEKDNGPADALNKGFNIATGDIFYFLNSDDELVDDSLFKVNEIFSTKKPDYLFGSGFIIDENSNIVRNYYPTNFTLNEYLYNSAVIFQQGVFFTKTLYDRSVKFNINNRVSWDGELFYEFKKLSKNNVLSHDKFGKFRIYPESGTGSGKLNKLNILQRNLQFIKELGREQNIFDKFLVIFYYFYKHVRHSKRFILIIKEKIT